MKKLCALGMIFLLALAAVCAQATDIRKLNLNDYYIEGIYVLGFSKDGKVAMMSHWANEYPAAGWGFSIRDLVTDEVLIGTGYTEYGGYDGLSEKERKAEKEKFYKEANAALAKYAVICAPPKNGSFPYKNGKSSIDVSVSVEENIHYEDDSYEDSRYPYHYIITAKNQAGKTKVLKTGGCFTSLERCTDGIVGGWVKSPYANWLLLNVKIWEDYMDTMLDYSYTGGFNLDDGFSDSDADQQKAEAAQRQAEEERRKAEAAQAELEAVKAKLADAERRAEEEKRNAESARSEAESARRDAQTARSEAESARGDAAAARNEAASAKSDAQRARSEAKSARSEADSAERQLRSAKNEQRAAEEKRERFAEYARSGVPAPELAEYVENLYANARIKVVGAGYPTQEVRAALRKTPFRLSLDLSEVEGLTSLPAEAFASCKSLEEVVLPEALLKVGVRTFSGCASLSSVSIPLSVTEISADAFENCPALKKAVYEGSKAQWKKIKVEAGNEPLTKSKVTFEDVASKKVNAAWDFAGGANASKNRTLLSFGTKLSYPERDIVVASDKGGGATLVLSAQNDISLKYNNGLQTSPSSKGEGKIAVITVERACTLVVTGKGSTGKESFDSKKRNSFSVNGVSVYRRSSPDDTATQAWKIPLKKGANTISVSGMRFFTLTCE